MSIWTRFIYIYFYSSRFQHLAVKSNKKKNLDRHIIGQSLHYRTYRHLNYCVKGADLAVYIHCIIILGHNCQEQQNAE